MSTYRKALNRAIFRFYCAALSIALRRPRHLPMALRCALNQFSAARKRNRLHAAGQPIPPMLILSITGRCNLSCRGCYSHHLGFSKDQELGRGNVIRILADAERLGVGTVLVAGGEPFVRADDIWEFTRKFPSLLFAIFSNGLLIDAAALKNIRKSKNIVPVISLEGHNADTDNRRGQGVANRVAGVLQALQTSGIFFGVSVTVSRDNFDHVLSASFVDGLVDSGCSLIFFVEYVPVEAGSEDQVIDTIQRQELLRRVEELRRTKHLLCVAFPGEEEEFGGCLAAGRGFVHISPSGMLEPCPFAPYSDTNLANVSLGQGLASPLLAAIRANHSRLQETRGGCALWNQRDWVRSLTEE